MEALDLSGVVSFERVPEGEDKLETFRVDLESIQSKQVDHLRTLSAKVAVLGEMAEKELRKEPFSDSEVSLFDLLISSNEAGSCDPGSDEDTYDGWYPKMVYAPVFDCDSRNEINFLPSLTIVDVHTDRIDTDHGDPGAVLHAGVGRSELLFVAVDDGDACSRLYVGPVFDLL